MSEQSYIGRVYRRKKTKPRSPSRRGTDRVRLDGIVEEPRSGERASFHGVEELWRLLVSS